MKFTYSPYILPLILAAVVSGWVVIYAWRRRNMPEATALSLMAFAITEWLLGYALEIAGVDLPTKLFWGKSQYIGITLVPLVWFIFSHYYANQNKQIALRYLLLLMVIPVITVALAFTTETHGLIWKTVEIEKLGSFSAMAVTYGVGFWVYWIYSNVLLLAGTFIVGRSLKHRQGLYHGQLFAIIVGLAAPWIGNVLYISGLSPIPHLDLTPFAFTVAVLALALGIFGYQLVNISPIARDLIVDGMSEGVIVTNTQGRIADINPAAGRMIGVRISHSLGKPLAEALAPWPHLVDRFRDVIEAHDQIVVGKDEAQRRYEIHISPLRDRQANLLGRIITIRDTSQTALPQPRYATQEEILSQTIPAEPVSVQKNKSLIPIMEWLVNFITTPVKTDLRIPPDINPKWHQARERSFTLILRVAALVGTFALLIAPSFAKLETGLSFAVIIALIWFLGLARNIDFQSRVIIFLLLVYVMASIETYNYGFSAASFTFFMTLIVSATLLLGRDGGLVAFLITTVTLGAFGVMIGNGYYLPVSSNKGIPFPGTFQQALTNLLAFSASATALIASIIILMESLNRAWQLETQALNLLQQERDLLNQRVTERTHDLAEARDEAVRSNNELSKYFLAIEQSGNTIVITDTQGNIEYANPRFVELTGYSLEEAVGKNPRILQSGEHRPEFYKELWSAISAGKIWHGEFHNRRKDGLLFWESATIAPLSNHLGKITNYVAIKEDVTQQKELQQQLQKQNEQMALEITERKQADEKLKVVNNDLKQAQFVAHLGNWKWNLKTSTVEWSDEMYNIFGIDKGPDTGRLGSVIAKVIHPDDLYIVLPENAAKFAKNKPQEYRIIRPKDGEIRHILAQAGESILDAQGNPVFLTGIAQDITERKLAEETLEKSEKQFRLLFEEMGSGVAVHEIICDESGTPADFRFLSVNTAFEKMTGLEASNILGKTVLEVIPETESSWIERYGKVALTGEPIQFEGFSEALGKYYEVRAYRPEHGKFVTIINDITERKQAEDELRVALIKYKTLFDCFPLGITVSDGAGNILETNSTAGRLLSVPEEDHTRRSIGGVEWKIVRSDGTPMPPEEFSSVRALKEKRVIENVEMGIVKADNSITWISVNAAPLPVEGYGVVVTYGDITERKQAEEDLRRIKEQYENIVNTVPVMLYKYVIHPDGSSNFLYVSPKMCREILELDSEVVLADMNLFWNMVHSKDLSRLHQEDAMANRAGKIFYSEVRITTPSSRIKWVALNSKPNPANPGEPAIWSGFLQDITTRKQAEEKLQHSEYNLAESERIGHTGSWEYDVASDTANWSENMFNIFDVDPAMPRELVFKYFVENLVYPDDRAHILSAFEDVLAGKRQYDLEYRVVKRDGSIRDIHALAETIRDEDGKAVRMIGKVEDITKRKQVEKELRFKNELLLMTSEMAKIGGWEFDALTQEGTWTDEVAYIHDLDPGQPTNVTLGSSFYLPDSRRKIELAIQQALESAQPYDLELQMISAKGNEKWVRTIGHPIMADGKVIKIQGIFQEITERKLAEDALRETNEYLENLINYANAPIIVWDPQFEITRFNHAFEILTGRSSADTLGKQLEILFPPALVQSSIQLIQKTQSGEHLEVVEISIQHVDGSIHAVLWNSATLFSSDGTTPIATIAQGQDITQRKQAEEKLRENISRLELAMQAANMAWWEMNIATGDITFSERKAKMLGYPPEQFKHYSDFMALVHPEDSDKAMNAMQRHIDGISDKYEVEYRISTKSEGYKWFYDLGSIVKRDSNVRPLNATGLAIDITERKRAEEKQINSELRYRRLFEAARDGIMILDSITGIVVDVNPFLVEMLCFPYEEFVGKKLWELGFFKDIAANKENFLELQRKEYICHEDLPLENTEGRKFHVEFVSNVYEVNHHKVIQCNIRDISERQRVGEELRKTMDDLARSNAELERFAYVASHDLQEPLRMVSSYMQLLERRYKDKLDSDALEFINYAVDGSNRMKILINDLLAYSRVGMRGEELAHTNSEEALANALTNLQASIEESKAKITHDPLPRVMADGTQLESLFQNLIGNAIKFHGSQPPLIHVGVKKDKNDWVFSVSDNGIGIDPQYFERIFILFQRLHNRQEYSGTGIGLAISKRIVERHGGRIWIESQAEKGSTFFFTLPIKGESL